jgi:hypothetical protein
MEAEHCLREGHSMSFTTSNYGVTTTPRAEWRFVVEGVSDGIDMRHSRRLPDIADLCRSELADSAKLTRAEVIAVVLYTGPMVCPIPHPYATGELLSTHPANRPLQ